MVLLLLQPLLPSMQSPRAADAAMLHSAMREIGMFAITDLGIASGTDADAFGGPLAAYSRCVHEGLLDVHVVDLGDATTRATLATATNQSIAQPLLISTKSCPDLARKAEGLRLAVDRVGRAYASLLDGLVHGKSNEDDMVASGADSFVDAVTR